MFFLTCVWISPGKKSPKLSNVKLTLALAESNENCQTLVTIKEFIKISQETILTSMSPNDKSLKKNMVVLSQYVLTTHGYHILIIFAIIWVNPLLVTLQCYITWKYTKTYSTFGRWSMHIPLVLLQCFITWNYLKAYTTFDGWSMHLQNMFIQKFP